MWRGLVLDNLDIAGRLRPVAAVTVGLPVTFAVVPDVKAECDVFVAASRAPKVADAKVSTDIAEGLRVVVELENDGSAIGWNLAGSASDEEVELDLNAPLSKLKFLRKPRPGSLVSFCLCQGENLVASAAVVDDLDAAVALGDNANVSGESPLKVFLDDQLDIPAKSRTPNEKSRQDAGQQGECSITVEHFFLRQVAAAVAHAEGGRGSV